MGIDNIKTFFNDSKTKVVVLFENKNVRIGSIVAGVVIFALIVTMVINSNIAGAQYTKLYVGLEPAEESEIYSALKLLGADTKMSSDGDILVLTEEFDVWLLKLAAEGYPKSGAPNYDVFSDNVGLTSTETEIEQWKLFSLQDRMEKTFETFVAVQEAIVGINIAGQSNYVWDQVTDQNESSASVTLTLAPNTSLDSSQVNAIKNLLAANVENLEPENVVVIDAKTSLELGGDMDDGNDNSISVYENLEFERMAQERIEENVINVLSKIYGTNGVAVSAKVTINYDHMITEQLELQTDENGEGYPTEKDVEAHVSQQEGVGGIVGEEDNTDTPTYPFSDAEDEDVAYYNSNVKIDYGYIKTQIEKGQATLERATVAVVVDDDNLSQDRRDEIVGLVSSAGDIPVEQIFVSTFDMAEIPPVEPEPVPENEIVQILLSLPWWIYLIAGVLVVLVIAFFVIMKLRHKKQLKLEQDKLLEEEREKQRIAEEIELYKKQLSDSAKSEDELKSDAIVSEIRKFAKHNPQITANLIRSWLKEGD